MIVLVQKWTNTCCAFSIFAGGSSRSCDCGAAAQQNEMHRKKTALLLRQNRRKQNKQRLQMVRPLCSSLGNQNLLQEWRSCEGSLLRSAKATQLVKHLEEDKPETVVSSWHVASQAVWRERDAVAWEILLEVPCKSNAVAQVPAWEWVRNYRDGVGTWHRRQHRLHKINTR